MLLDLREAVRNSKPIKYSLITLICIPFVLVGIGSYFSGGSAASVAEVNGQSIDQQQLERAYQQQRQQMARMFGGQLPEAFANESLLRQQALQQLITQQVLESEVVEQKFAVGDATLGRVIRNQPYFQVDGRFDADTYQTQLRASGMSVAMFEQTSRDTAVLDQFKAGIMDTSFTLPQEAERLAALGRQTRTIEAVRFDFEKAREAVDVTDEEVSAYFEENQDNYQFPQRAKIQYIELSSDVLAADVDVTEEQAQAYYDENRGNYMLPEQRDASHILLNLDDSSEEEQIAALNDIKTRIAGGESFEDLAKEFSDDAGSAESGGSLGAITPGAMVAEFEEAVFAIAEAGGLSEPVTTDFGVHLIRVDKITPESGKPFDEVSEEVTATLKNNEADRDFFDLREQLIEVSFDNPDSLDPAADATGLEVKTSDWLDSETDSGFVLSNPQVMAAMFSEEVLDEDNNSELIEVGDRHVVVLRVLEHEDPRPKTLADVEEDATKTLKGERATEQLATLVESALEQLKAGETAAKIAEGDVLATAFEQEVLDRQSSVFGGAAITRIFSLPKPGNEVVADSVTLEKGDQLALRLDAIAVPEVVTDTAATDEPMSPPAAGVDEAGANPRLGGIEYQALVESLRGAADVNVLDAASP